MRKKIKTFLNKPLTMGWLVKWSVISFILSGIVSVISLNRMGLFDPKQLFKPSSDWEDIPEEE